MVLFSFISGFAWGLMEGTWFFIVPDVLLCYWALRSWRAAMVSTIAVVLGSMLAACLLYAGLHGGWFSVESLHEFWSLFPGFKSKMADTAAWHLSEAGGVKGLLSGPKSGIPFRIYVVEAWKQQLPLAGILARTPLARLQRILIAPVATLALRWALLFVRGKFFTRVDERLVLRGLAVLLIVYWVGLYIWYWGSFVPQTYGS
jgi:hypothetical protein